jgi:hypothetical protein
MDCLAQFVGGCKAHLFPMRRSRQLLPLVGGEHQTTLGRRGNVSSSLPGTSYGFVNISCRPTLSSHFTQSNNLKTRSKPPLPTAQSTPVGPPYISTWELYTVGAHKHLFFPNKYVTRVHCQSMEYSVILGDCAMLACPPGDGEATRFAQTMPFRWGKDSHTA